MDPYGTMAYTAADAVTDILGAGKASRFYRRLIADGPGWFTEADASISGSEHRGYLMLNARLANENVDIDAARRLLVNEACRLFTDMPPSDHEVQRLINRQNSMFVLNNIDYLSQAQTMAMAAAHGEDSEAQLRRYRALTPQLIAVTARDIFTAHNATLITRPESQ